MRFHSFFKPRLKTGRKDEKIAQPLICQANNVSIISEQTDDNYGELKYDFQTSDGIKYEVKGGESSDKFHSFFIEFEQSIKGKLYVPSGIADSEANYWMLKYKNTFYTIDRKILIQKCMSVGERRHSKQNPDVKTWGMIVSVEELRPFCTLYPIS